MARGRPSLLHKDGHHRHTGYERWHPVDQSHSDASFHKSLETSSVTTNLVSKMKEEFQDYTDIFNLLVDIEKGILSNEIIKELEQSIEILVKESPDRGEAGPSSTRVVGVQNVPTRSHPQTGSSLHRKRSDSPSAPQSYGPSEIPHVHEEEDDPEVKVSRSIKERAEDAHEHRRKLKSRAEDDSGSPGEDKGDYPIGDAEDTREPNPLGIP